jgi:origin recognition complex subunit 1
MPGTGKTVTVYEVVGSLKQLALECKLPPFTFVEINCLKLPEPQAAYSELWKAMVGETVAPRAALKNLEATFRKGREKSCMVVAVIDELDFLVSSFHVKNSISNLPPDHTPAGGHLQLFGMAATPPLEPGGGWNQ